MSISPLLGLGIATSSAMTGYEQGKQQAQTEFDAEEARQQRRAQALQQKQVGDLQLAQLNRQEQRAQQISEPETEQLKLQIMQQQQTLTQQGQKAFRDDTYRVLDNYLEDYDVKHINNLIAASKQNQFAPQTFRDTVRVEDLNLTSTADRQELTKLGVSQAELDALDGKADGKIDWTLVQKRYKKAIQADGSVQIKDVLKLAMFAGYGQYANDKKLTEAGKLADINKKITAAQPKPVTPPQPTYTSRDAQEFAMRKLAQEGIQPTDPSYQTKLNDYTLSWFQQGQAGSKFAQVEIAKEADAKLKSKMNLPFEQFREDAEVRKYVAELEMANPLSTADRKELQDIADLAGALTGEFGATELTTEQTGIIDKYVGNIQKKITEGFDTRTKNSYGAFINKFRNNLFGATLTDGEREAFEKAYSADSDKLAPVLGGLRAAAKQLSDRFNAIANQNHEAVIKYKTGTTGAQLKDAIKRIDAKINELEQIAAGKGKPMQPAQPTPKPAAPVQTNDLIKKYNF